MTEQHKSLFLDPKVTKHFEKVVFPKLVPSILVIMRDTVDNCLRDFEDSKRLSRDWVTPLLIVCGLVSIFAVTDFKSFPHVTADMLRGASWLLVVVVASWAVWAGFRAVREGGMSRQQVLARLEAASMNKADESSTDGEKSTV